MVAASSPEGGANPLSLLPMVAASSPFGGAGTAEAVTERVKSKVKFAF